MLEHRNICCPRRLWDLPSIGFTFGIHASASQDGEMPFKMFAHCHVAPICHKICHCWIGVSECANGEPEILCKVPSICVSKCCLQMNRGSRLVCQSVLADAGCQWGVVASQGVLSDGAIVLLPSNTVCLLYELPPRALPESPSKSGTCAKCTFHVAGKQYWCR